MIFRRLPASSSFVLAAARLRAFQLDPGRATRRPGHLRGRSRRTVSPARTAGRSHRARSVRPLDSGGPYGCRVVRAHGCEPRIRVAATRSGGKLRAADVGTVEADLWLRQPGQIAIPYRRSGEFLDLGSQFPGSIASVDDRARLEQKHCGFGIGARAVLDAARDDEELPRCEHHIAISHLNGEPPVQDQEELVSVGMLMK